MTVDQLKTAICTLLQPILGGTVIWADQSAPRPALPYTTLRLGVVTPIGEPHYSDSDNSGVQTVLSVRESVLNVQRFGPGSVAALQTFTDKMQLNTNLDKFSVQAMSLFDMSPVTDIAELLNGISIEPRASVDVSIRWTSSQTDTVGVVQTVEIGGGLGPEITANNETYQIDISLDAY